MLDDLIVDRLVERTLPTGTISMGQVNVELERPSAQSISFNDPEVRELAERPSGSISMNDLRGKSAWIGTSFTMTVGGTSGVKGYYQSDYGSISPRQFTIPQWNITVTPVIMVGTTPSGNNLFWVDSKTSLRGKTLRVTVRKGKTVDIKFTEDFKGLGGSWSGKGDPFGLMQYPVGTKLDINFTGL